jgi:hypothetical protein
VGGTVGLGVGCIVGDLVGALVGAAVGAEEGKESRSEPLTATSSIYTISESSSLARKRIFRFDADMDAEFEM